MVSVICPRKEVRTEMSDKDKKDPNELYDGGTVHITPPGGEKEEYVKNVTSVKSTAGGVVIETQYQGFFANGPKETLILPPGTKVRIS